MTLGQILCEEWQAILLFDQGNAVIWDDFDEGQQSLWDAAASAFLVRLGVEDLRAAAWGVVNRWDSPLWKDAEPTGHVVNRLRAALEAGVKP